MKHARGFTLIELLIAVLVLSVGLLGSAALLLRSLQDQALALRHQQAALLLADIADRIRANLAGRRHYASGEGTGIVRANCELPPGCNAQALAERDVAQFQAAVHATFGALSPESTVVFVPATGPATPDRIDISIRWRDARDADSPEHQRVSVWAQSPVAG